jgi:hypothetical protein
VTTNPRNRNRRLDSPHATQPARLPAVEAARTGNRAVDEVLDAIRGVLEVRAGSTGNPQEKWTTRRDLGELGLTGSPQLDNAPDDFAGLPVWTSRNKYVLLNMRAVAVALVEHITALMEDAEGDDQPVTREEFDLLVQRVAAIRPGTSQAEVERLLAQLRTALERQWAQDIGQAVQALGTALYEQIDALNTQMAQALAAGRRYVHVQDPAALVWTVDHGLGRYPSGVIVRNLDGEKIEPDIEFTSGNQLVITHGEAIAGTAVVS